MNENLTYQPPTPSSQTAALYKQGLDLIPLVAGRILGRIPSYAPVTRDDLESAGREGLVKAVQHYDPQRGEFKPFAEWRIKGAMLDELRATDHFTRSLRQETEGYKRHVRNFEQEYGRSPEPEEAMRDLSLGIDEYHALRFAVDLGQSLVSLDAVLHSDEDPKTPVHTKDPEHQYFQAEAQQELRNGLARLSTKQRQLVDMLLSGISPADAARELGVTDAAISHRLRDSEATLRQYFERRGLLS